MTLNLILLEHDLLCKLKIDRFKNGERGNGGFIQSMEQRRTAVLSD
jgi:hypothetical protein